MAQMVYFNPPPSLSPKHHHHHPCFLQAKPPLISLRTLSGQRRRGWSVVTRGAPGTSTYVFALVLPLSLLAATVFTAIRIDDKLDRDFLQEVAINRAIMEENEDGDEVIMPSEKKPSLPRRNRPRREAETSTM